ncbi:unnamed protein product, partial [Mesorhabditis spiculigera]
MNKLLVALVPLLLVVNAGVLRNAELPGNFEGNQHQDALPETSADHLELVEGEAAPLLPENGEAPVDSSCNGEETDADREKRQCE